MEQATRQWTATDWTDFVHTGPDSLCGQYLRRFWQPVEASANLPPGRAKPIRLMSEDFTLYRGEDGTAHLVDFRCAHRGTQLSTGWVEGDEIRCFYHGWKYNGVGQCTEQPAEPEPFCSRIKIRSYPTQEYLGLIFVYLGPGEAPSMRRFPEFEEEGLIEARYTTIWPCNYMNRMDNDPVHVAFVHRTGTLAEGGRVGIPRFEQFEETDFGMLAVTRRPNGVRDGRYHLMPNLVRFFPPASAGFPPNGSLGWTVPIDDTHHAWVIVTLVPVKPEEMAAYLEQREARRAVDSQVQATEVGEACLRGELHPDDVAADPSRRDILINVQDYTSMVGQGAIPDYRQDHLGQTDVMITAWRKLMQRELRALAEGRPLKNWSQPVRLTFEGLTGASHHTAAPA
jgi:5,5'-dehydrodivanillate O-demethylase oxygenase subunit